MNQQFQPQRRTIRLEQHDYSSAGAYFATICTETRGLNWFGQVSSSDGVQLSPAGEMVRCELERLPLRFPNLEIDEFIVMPDHVHVIFVLHAAVDAAINVEPIQPAALGDVADASIRRGEPRVRPATHAERNSKPNQLEGVSRSVGVQQPFPAIEFGDSRVVTGDHKDRPYENPAGTDEGSLGRIVQAFKSLTTVQYVRGVRESGWPSFEKRFWERVLRDDAELEVKRAYIAGNPTRHLEKRGRQ